MEYWKLFNEKGYFVSNIGRFKREKSIKSNPEIIRTIYLTPHKSKVGYTEIHVDGRTVKCHRIIATAFIPNPYNKPQVNHINGIKSDNRIENLEWVTRSENAIHAHKTGLITPKRGSDSGRAILKENEVSQIRILFEHGITPNILSKIFGVTPSVVSNIVARRIWKHI